MDKFLAFGNVLEAVSGQLRHHHRYNEGLDHVLKADAFLVLKQATPGEPVDLPNKLMARAINMD